MITTNVYQRTFFIRVGDKTGTAFTIDVAGRQYLITAQHVVDGVGTAIEVYHDGDWKQLDIQVVGAGNSAEISQDIGVLAAGQMISAKHPLPATSQGVVFGQQVYFLGFPYGLHTLVDINGGFPIALVKGGLLAGTLGSHGNGGEIFLIDGHNNPGFSGGPVVFRKPSEPNGPFSVLGVVSAYRQEDLEVTLQGSATALTSKANSGIVMVPSIKRATDMIEANPVGFLLED